MKAAVFLDRDGTLIEEKEYLRSPEQVVFLPGAVAGLRRLSAAGIPLFLVTNQSGVGRGYFSLDDVEKVHAHISGALARDGVFFKRIYVAPEAPDQPSRGRKPSPAFLFDARDEFGIDLSHSFMVGDKLIDLQCGWNAGVKKSILVRTGYGRALERDVPEKIVPGLVVENLGEAAEWILQPAAFGGAHS